MTTDYKGWVSLRQQWVEDLWAGVPGKKKKNREREKLQKKNRIRVMGWEKTLNPTTEGRWCHK